MMFDWTRFLTEFVKGVDEIESSGVAAKFDEKSMFVASNFWELFARFEPNIRFV